MTVPNNAIHDVANMLYKAGVACDFEIDESLLPTMIDMARARYPNKKIRAVKNWIWWDLEVSEDTRCQFEVSGVKPAIVFSHYLIWNSSRVC